MSNLVTMYDATSPGNLPKVNDKDPGVALAAYCDGNYAGDWIGMMHAFPTLAAHSRIVSIASRFTTIARIIDYEPHQPIYGNLDGVAKWVLRMLARGVLLPGAYADRSDMPGIQKAYVANNVPRDKTVLWLAAPGVSPTLYLGQGFNAVQDHFDGTYDVSVCKPNFFPSLVPDPLPKPAPHDVLAHADVRFTHAGGQKGTRRVLVTHKLDSTEWKTHKLGLAKGDWSIKHLGRVKG